MSEEDNVLRLKTFSYIADNKDLAPRLGMDFPAHNTDNSKSCLNCHGLSEEVASSLVLMNNQFKGMGFRDIPPVPHKHKLDLDGDGIEEGAWEESQALEFNCFFCHKPDWSK